MSVKSITSNLPAKIIGITSLVITISLVVTPWYTDTLFHKGIKCLIFLGALLAFLYVINMRSYLSGYGNGYTKGYAVCKKNIENTMLNLLGGMKKEPEEKNDFKLHSIAARGFCGRGI